MDEPSSPRGIALYGVYNTVLKGSVLDNACHGWSFDQQGTCHKSTTCLMTVICHEMGSEEWPLVNMSAMGIARACCFAMIQHKMAVL